MRSRFSLLFSVCALLLIVSACSSTTVVSRNERPAQQAEPAESASTDDAAAVETDTPDTTEASDTEADRGGRIGDDPLTPRELEEAQGFGLGGADQLASLLTDCEADNDMACDILFELSAFDSPEETVALNCGGRSDDAPIFCTAGVSALPDEFVFDPASAGLAEIVDSCRAGDYTACDFLYFRSPFESEFEEIGGTCGDRVQVAVPDCRTFLTDAE